MARPRDDFVDAAHADDFAGGAGDILANAALFEFADGLARAQKLSSEIDIKDELPISESHVLDPGVLLDARHY